MSEEGKELDSVEGLIRVVPDRTETVFDFLNEAGEDVRSIKIERRELQRELPRVMPVRPLERNPARSHVFNDVNAFCDYLMREASTEGAVILADVNSHEIAAVLNENIEEDREIVSLQAIEHPVFAPWGQLFGAFMEATEFALFVMKNRRVVRQPDGRELALTFSQIKMSKSITVNAGVGAKALNGLMCEVSIAGEKRDQLVELPDAITIQVPLFVGTPEQDIEIDLLVTERHDKATVVMTASDVELQRITAFQEMVGAIKQETGLLVGLGQVKHRPWRMQELEVRKTQ